MQPHPALAEGRPQPQRAYLTSASGHSTPPPTSLSAGKGSSRPHVTFPGVPGFCPPVNIKEADVSFWKHLWAGQNCVCAEGQESNTPTSTKPWREDPAATGEVKRFTESPLTAFIPSRMEINSKGLCVRKKRFPNSQESDLLESWPPRTDCASVPADPSSGGPVPVVCLSPREPGPSTPATRLLGALLRQPPMHGPPPAPRLAQISGPSAGPSGWVAALRWDPLLPPELCPHPVVGRGRLPV